MKMLTKKQGDVGNLQGFILGIVGVGVILAIGLVILSNLQTTMTVDSAAANATGLSQSLIMSTQDEG